MGAAAWVQRTVGSSRTNGFLALMRRRNYALLWTGQLISQMGDRLHWLAISLWVYALTGSALQVSLVQLGLGGGQVVGLVAGALVDRWDHRRTMIVADLVRAALTVSVPLLIVHSVGYAYAAIFLLSSASVFFRPAMLAVIPRSVRRDELLRANSYFSGLDNFTELSGPAVAGLVVMRLGYSAAFYLDALSYLGSAICVTLLTLPPQDRGPGGGGVRNVLRDVVDGFRYVGRDRLQLALFLVLPTSALIAAFDALQTPLAKGVLGMSDAQFGIMSSFHGAGLLVGSLAVAWWGSRCGQGRLLAWGLLVHAVVTTAIGLSPAPVALMLGMALWGAANMVWMNTGLTLLMSVTPEGYMGRIVATRRAVWQALRAVTLVGGGWLADAVGVRAAVVLTGGAAAVWAAWWARRFPEVVRAG